MSAVTKSASDKLGLNSNMTDVSDRIRAVASTHGESLPTRRTFVKGTLATSSSYNELWGDAKLVVSGDSHLRSAINVTNTFPDSTKAFRGTETSHDNYNFLAGTVSRVGTTINEGVVTYMETICHHFSAHYNPNHTSHYNPNHTSHYNPNHTSHYVPDHSTYYASNNSRHHDTFYASNNSNHYKSCNSGYYASNNSGHVCPTNC